MSREQFWFFHPFRVRYSEIDGQGVVFNAHYLTYFDTTITEYFRALGYDQYADAKQTGEDFHVVKSVIEYKAPVRFDWELDVGARVARIGNSSMTFELAIFLKGGNEALVTGEIIWVNTNQQTHRPVPISKANRKRVDQMQGRGARLRQQHGDCKERKRLDAVLMGAERAGTDRIRVEGGIARPGIVEMAIPGPFDRGDRQQIEHQRSENAPFG